MIKFKIVPIIVLLLVSTAFLSSSCSRHIAKAQETKKYYYTCPMHPNDIYYTPGKCPKCGMELEAWDMKDMPKDKSASHSGHSDSNSSHSGCH